MAGYGNNQMIFLALQLSIGVGINAHSDLNVERKDYKGIVQIEQPITDDISMGFWHHSRLENGFNGSPDDQNII